MRGKAARTERRRQLAQAIDLTWESLRSHLADSVQCRRGGGNEEWQARCVKDYAKVIYTLSVELHELTKQDFPAGFYAQRDKI